MPRTLARRRSGQTNNNLLSFPYRRPDNPASKADGGAPRERSSPLALPEYRHAPAVSVKSVDVDLAGADHPVDVDQAAVSALGCDLLGLQLRSVDEALRVALAERDVAGGILIEQRVEEQ